MPKLRKRTDYCNADARRMKAKRRRLRAVHELANASASASAVSIVPASREEGIYLLLYSPVR